MAMALVGVVRFPSTDSLKIDRVLLVADSDMLYILLQALST
jgi:hypothetical protein